MCDGAVEWRCNGQVVSATLDEAPHHHKGASWMVVDRVPDSRGRGAFPPARIGTPNLSTIDRRDTDEESWQQ